MTEVSAVAMSPVRTWNDINKILDSIDWREFFDMIDGNNQFQALGRSQIIFQHIGLIGFCKER